ncbi:MAG: hypothetical protein ACXVNQ_10930 [Bacteroidia bacterium]
MRTTKNTTNKQNKQGNSKKHRPEIRDDMDSRERKENGFKGNDKATKAGAKKKAKK